MAAKISAGLLMYRMTSGVPEVLLVHPGGPFFKNKDDGAWDFPKGEAEEGESDLLSVAKREFEEETGFKAEGDFKFLGSVSREQGWLGDGEGGGKIIKFWTFEGDCDPTQVKSNKILIDWPPRSGKKLEIPEIDRARFFSLEEAKKKVFKYHLATLKAFEEFLGKRS